MVCNPSTIFLIYLSSTICFVLAIQKKVEPSHIIKNMSGFQSAEAAMQTVFVKKMLVDNCSCIKQTQDDSRNFQSILSSWNNNGYNNWHFLHKKRRFFISTDSDPECHYCSSVFRRTRVTCLVCSTFYFFLFVLLNFAQHTWIVNDYRVGLPISMLIRD